MSEENISKREAIPKSDSSTLAGDDQKGSTAFNQSGQTVTNQTNIGSAGPVMITNTSTEGVPSNQTLDTADLEKKFADLNQRIEKMEDGVEKTIAQTTVQGLKEEAEKGDKADETKVQRMFNSLLNVAPDAWDVAVAAFVNPVAGVGMAFKKIAERAKAEQAQK